MNYMKAFAAVLAAVATAVVAAATGNGEITSLEWVNVAITGVGAASVFAAPNVPGAEYTKTILAVLTASLVLLSSVIVGGVTYTEWLQVLASGLGSLAVFGVKNTTKA